MHACLKTAFMEEGKCHNLMTWLIFFHKQASGRPSEMDAYRNDTKFSDR